MSKYYSFSKAARWFRSSSHNAAFASSQEHDDFPSFHIRCFSASQQQHDCSMSNYVRNSSLIRRSVITIPSSLSPYCIHLFTDSFNSQIDDHHVFPIFPFPLSLRKFPQLLLQNDMVFSLCSDGSVFEDGVSGVKPSRFPVLTLVLIICKIVTHSSKKHLYKSISSVLPGFATFFSSSLAPLCLSISLPYLLPSILVYPPFLPFLSLLTLLVLSSPTAYSFILLIPLLFHRLFINLIH